MRPFRGIIFIGKGTYRKIFKSAFSVPLNHAIQNEYWTLI